MKVSNENIPFQPAHAKQLETLRFGNYNNQNIRCRDPFIMPYGDKYYFYVTATSARAEGILCYVSDDLQNWSDPVKVYTPPKDFHGEKQFFWAPECHYYKGYFYIFTSVYSSKYQHRTISVYRSENPLGPFEDITGGAISPTDWDAIDGTLYIDKQNNPWLVFVHEWTCMPDKNGGMVAARLSEDFTHLISEPIQLFLAKDPDWTDRGVTDGPYLYRTDNGDLLMIWSNFSPKGYVVAIAKSDNGEITGKWSQEKLLYQQGLNERCLRDGGHGSIFKRKDGTYMLSLHSPQSLQEGEEERLLLLPIRENGGTIEI